jgi:hypothetical protein
LRATRLFEAVFDSHEGGGTCMAIGIYFAPAAMSAAQYDECIKLLRKAGAGNPPGRSYHASFGPADKIAVFDVWTSQAAFDRFGKTLMPILEQLGVDPGQPAVMPIRKVIVPARPAAAPAKAARKATAPKSKRRR